MQTKNLTYTFSYKFNLIFQSKYCLNLSKTQFTRFSVSQSDKKWKVAKRVLLRVKQVYCDTKLPPNPSSVSFLRHCKLKLTVIHLMRCSARQTVSFPRQ